MKKWLTLTLLLFCIPALVWGWGTVIISGSVPASSSCSTPSYGDELNEGFLGTGYENTWVETENGTINEDYTLSGSPPPNSCSEGLYISSDGNYDDTYWDRGSAIPYTTTVDLYIELYISSITIEDWSTVKLLEWSSGTDGSYNYICALVLKSHSAGDYYLLAGSATDSSEIPISTNTWYRIKIHCDSTAANSYIQINEGTQCTFTRDDINGQYLHLSSYGIGNGESIIYEVGYCYVDTP